MKFLLDTNAVPAQAISPSESPTSGTSRTAPPTPTGSFAGAGSRTRSASGPKTNPSVPQRIPWAITEYRRNLKSTSAGKPG